MNPSIVPSRFWGPGLVVFAAAVATVFAGRPASTCSIAGLADHTLDAGELAADTHPPSAPQVSAVNVQRAERSGGGCGAGSFPDPDACGGLASVKIVVSASTIEPPRPKWGTGSRLRRASRRPA